MYFFCVSLWLCSNDQLTKDEVPCINISLNICTKYDKNNALKAGEVGLLSSSITVYHKAI